MRRLAPSCTLFPYTTLFRSEEVRCAAYALDENIYAFVDEALASAVGGRGARRRTRRCSHRGRDRKSTRLNSHRRISYAGFCLQKKKQGKQIHARCRLTDNES